MTVYSTKRSVRPVLKHRLLQWHMEEENEQRILSLNKNNFNTGLTTLQLQGIFYFILAEQKNISPFIVFNLEKKLTLYCSYSWVSE